MMTTEYFIQAVYLASSVLFILGIKGLTRPEKARRGMQYAAVGMLLAIVGTLLHHEIITYTWIILGLIIGSGVGAAMSIFMPMTAIPQRTAISHAFGALAATLVGIAEYIEHVDHLSGATMAALGFEVMFGSLTIRFRTTRTSRCSSSQRSCSCCLFSTRKRSGRFT
jgi:NAD(P) transhydrogenase subunit beta